jgi:hypothetical protein
VGAFAKKSKSPAEESLPGFFPFVPPPSPFKSGQPAMRRKP